MYEQLQEELAHLPASIRPEDLSLPGLMSFPPGLSKLLLWILRRRAVLLEVVAEFIEQDPETTRDFLDSLVQRGLIEMTETVQTILPETGELSQGKQYRLRVHSSRSYRLPGKIWDSTEE